MASPFVPVDLDKLLDEFEEKEEETKPEQLASFGKSNTNGKLADRRSFQAPFPSIEEEVLSDQGSDQHISYHDKRSSSSESDSDNDSTSGVIETAEAITNQSSCHLQNTQGLVLVDENISNEFKENMVIADYAPSEILDGNNASSTIEDGNSMHFELNEDKHLNQYGYVQVNDETETACVPSELCASESPKEIPGPGDDIYCVENETRNSTDVFASSVLYSETSPELHQEQITSGSADQGMHLTDRSIKYDAEQSGVDDISQYNTHRISYSSFSVSDSGMSNVPVATDLETYFAEVNQTLESLGSLEEQITCRPGLDIKQITHGPVLYNEQVTSDYTDQDRHSTEQCGASDVNRYNTLGLTDSNSEVTSSELNATPVQNIVSGSSQSQDDECYLNGNRNGEPTVSPQNAQVGEPVTSNDLVNIDSEVNQILGESVNTSNSLVAVDSEVNQITGEPVTSNDLVYIDSEVSHIPGEPVTSNDPVAIDSEANQITGEPVTSNVLVAIDSEVNQVPGEPVNVLVDIDSELNQVPGEPVTSNVLVDIDSELNQVPDSETQAVYDDQAGASSLLTPHAYSQGEPSAEYDLDTGSPWPPIPNELDEDTHSPPPDLSITLHSQGSLEARRITSGEANLGQVPPIWVPDSVATHCMNCGVKFSVIKRRHHCRACGKALCSSCCNMKFLLAYMDNKEGRVCQVCCNALLRAQALLQVVDNQANENIRGDDDDDDDNDDDDDELSQTEDFMLDNGLEEEEEQHDDELEQEIAEDVEAAGYQDTADFTGAGVNFASEHTAPVLPPLQLPVAPPQDMDDMPLATPTSPALSDDSDCLFRLDIDNVRSLLPQDITALPPVVKVTDEETSIHERPDPAEIMYQIKGLHETVVFLLNKNLVVKVSIVKLSCCVKRKCWCFVTEGMGSANQEEMVVLLECLRKETMLPKDVLSHFNTAFAYAKQGHTVSELGYTIFGQPFLGSSDNAGFLYVKPTYQCLKRIPIPSTPYVVGILIKRQETPWAQLFPLRLQLRLGAEYRYYPCPLFSSRNRSAVYGEVGHTIMNLLVDFKNFQYTLARVTGLVIHMEEKKTLVRLPQDRYDEVVKILNATDEHVMALGANFSLQADSHLVCIQSEQGYKTQAINIQNQARKVTGASFIVFSGAMKSSSPFMAKVNIIEDGIMVQLMPEAITKLRNSLKEMKDFTITTGIPGGGGEEQVIVEWVSRKDAPHQSSLCSPIDGLQLDGFSGVKVHSGYDFTRKSAFRIQWTEMFFLGDGQQSASRDLNKLTAELAKAFGRTLMPYLSKLSSDNCTFIGLRVNLDNENVGYFTGSNQQSLPASIMSDLDDVLVPVLHAAASHHRGRALSVELLFKILRLL